MRDLHPFAHPAPRLAAALAVAALSLPWAGAAHAATFAGLGVGTAAAEQALRAHPLTRLDGGTLTLSAMQGEVVVLDLWATWCAPCRKALPKLDALHRELAGRGGRVIAIALDEDRGNVQRFARTHGLTLPIAQDGPDGLARELALTHVPMALVIGRDGRIAYASSREDEAGMLELATTAKRLAAEGGPAAAAVGGAR